MDELISRKALRERLDALSEIFRRRGENEDKGFLAVQCGVMFADCEVWEAPTIDTERHGRWVRKDNSKNCKRVGDFEEWHECSACEGNSDYESEYCPNCGARMDGEGEKDG